MPSYNKKPNFRVWSHDICPECNDIGYCNLPSTNGSDAIECLCQLGQTDANYCLLKPDRMKRMWEIRGKHIPDKTSPFREDFLEQLAMLGYANMTDEVNECFLIHFLLRESSRRRCLLSKSERSLAWKMIALI